MHYTEKLPMHKKYSWSFDDAQPYGAELVKSYHHRITEVLPLHIHDFYELNIVVSGSGRHYIGDRNVPTQAGDVFVIPPDVEHGYRSDGSLDVFHILLSNSLLAKHSDDLTRLPGYKMLFEIEPVLRCRLESTFYLSLKGDEFQKYLTRISDIQKDNDKNDIGHNIRQSFKVLAFIAVLCEQMAVSQRLSEDVPKPHAVSVLKSIEHIESKFSEKIMYTSLAENCQMSYSTYLRVFKQLTGTTPVKYQQNCKLKKAAELLEFSDETVLSIALDVGYYDSAHFIREFIRFKGVSPTQYRDSLKK